MFSFRRNKQRAKKNQDELEIARTPLDQTKSKGFKKKAKSSSSDISLAEPNHDGVKLLGNSLLIDSNLESNSSLSAFTFKAANTTRLTPGKAKSQNKFESIRNLMDATKDHEPEQRYKDLKAVLKLIDEHSDALGNGTQTGSRLAQAQELASLKPKVEREIETADRLGDQMASQLDDVEAIRDPDKKRVPLNELIETMVRPSYRSETLQQALDSANDQLAELQPKNEFEAIKGESEVSKGYVGKYPNNAEGWKLHVTASPYSSKLVLDTTIKYLRDSGVSYKYLTTVSDDQEGNQARKFIAVYPTSKVEAKRVAADLDRLLLDAGLEEYSLQNEQPVGDSGRVYARYGAFTNEQLLNSDGNGFIEDDRTRIKPDHIPAWDREDSGPFEFSNYNLGRFHDRFGGGITLANGEQIPVPT